ncbi:hypothetical protein [Bacillus sp. 1P06AnD]|uniref:hypothetical protein n=1 Tax=Bacillus sp. 1P06AnD TaxID=3132208 RepID=UPI0039A0F908
MELIECTLFIRELNRLVIDFYHCQDQDIKQAIQSDIGLLSEALATGINMKKT